MAFGRSLCLVVACVAVAAPVFAQPPARAASSGAPGSERWAAHRAEWEARRQAHDRQRSADIALLLRLRPDQQVAFQAMEAALAPSEGGREGWKPEGGAASPATTAQALDRMQARMAAHEQRMRAHLDAVRRFYAALSPEQQGLFDALMRLRHGGGEGGRGHGGPQMMHGEGPGARGGLEPPAPPPGV